MALRLQMKLGVIAETDRAPDSADTIEVVEPTVGSRARSKGHLFLLVTSSVPGPRAREATRLVAEAIKNEYYYDESAGIRVCIVKAIHAANKRLSHVRERSGLGRAGEPGPVGVAIAVVRDNELYVSTVGPAEAYLSRGARLSTLPDPHRDRGLPSADLEPDVWRGEIGVGDQLMLISPNLTGRLGPDELKDALVTLHPQSAMEHLHHRFLAAGGSGSDGAIAIEAAEVSQSRAGRAPVPVRPPEPLAGVPDRSPIPLADSVSGGMAAARASAGRARTAAGGLLGSLVLRVQDMLPNRSLPARRVTPMPTRREMQRRAAVAVLVFIGVAGVLGIAISVLGSHQPSGPIIASVEAGQQALAAARADLDRVSGPGVDLVTNDPKKAETLLKDALEQLKSAEAAGIPLLATQPLRTRAVAFLDRLYGMVDIAPNSLFTFPSETKPDLRALVKGPDGAPYVLDAATASVYRIDLAEKKATIVFREGTKAAGKTQAAPRLLSAGGRDVLILDAKNVLWRWIPADATGKGTTKTVNVLGASEWGDDVIAIGTYLRDAKAGLYNLYVVAPSAQQILAYMPSADGGGYPNTPANRLATARPVSDMTSLYIDGDIYVTEAGTIVRFVGGKSEGWEAEAPPDSAIRTAPTYTLVTSGTGRREGRLYGYDPLNHRVVALGKAKGTYLEQYRLSGDPSFVDIRGWYVEPGGGDLPDTLVWIDPTGLHRAVLEATAVAPGGSASPGASTGTDGSAGPASSPASSGAVP